MRTSILIAAALLISTSVHAAETRGLIVPQATQAEAPVILSAEQLAKQEVQQAAVQPAAPAPLASQGQAQQPPTATQVINGTHAQQPAPLPSQPGQPTQQSQLTPEQQAAQQQQAMRQQQMAQQRRMQQQRMQQQRMQQQQMARNMTPEQKVAYKVHEVKTKLKMKLVNVLLR